MGVVIIKYNAGNIRSVKNALSRLGVEAEITDDFEQIRKAEKVIFPGVGEASSTMTFLKEKKLDVLIRELKQPFLGICLGQQLMCSHSEEGDTDCLGVFDLPVMLFPPKEKIPHMGWNQIGTLKSQLFEGVEEGAYVYFVHSYYVPVGEETIATCKYMFPFSAAVQKGNYYATQFHPEKSGDTGAKILKNFIDL